MKRETFLERLKKTLLEMGVHEENIHIWGNPPGLAWIEKFRGNIQIAISCLPDMTNKKPRLVLIGIGKFLENDYEKLYYFVNAMNTHYRDTKVVLVMDEDETVFILVWYDIPPGVDTPQKLIRKIKTIATRFLKEVSNMEKYRGYIKELDELWYL